MWRTSKCLIIAWGKKTEESTCAFVVSCVNRVFGCPALCNHWAFNSWETFVIWFNGDTLTLKTAVWSRYWAAIISSACRRVLLVTPVFSLWEEKLHRLGIQYPQEENRFYIVNVTENSASTVRFSCEKDHSCKKRNLGKLRLESTKMTVFLSDFNLIFQNKNADYFRFRFIMMIIMDYNFLIS